MKKNCFVVMFLTFILAAAIPQMSALLACSCMKPPPPSVALAKTDAVFSGKVLRVDTLFVEQLRRAHLEIHEIWKGDEKKAQTIHTAIHSAACGYDFVEGQSYLIYAFIREDGAYRTDLCTRTRPLSEAGDDLAFLEYFDRFPMHIGNKWYFSDSTAETILDTAEIAGEVYYQFNRFREFRSPLLHLDDSGKVWIRSDSLQQVWVDFGADIGESWRVSGPHRQSMWTVSLESKTDVVETGLGTIADCFRFYFRFDGSDNDWIEWYAPGIGPVSRHLLGFALLEFPLQAAVIDGRRLPTSVGENPAGTPIRAFTLHQNFPNPISVSAELSHGGATRIHYELNHAGLVSLRVFDLNGRLIDEILQRYQRPGEYQIRWEGRNLGNRIVPAGVYFYELRLGNSKQTRRLLVLP